LSLAGQAAAFEDTKNCKFPPTQTGEAVEFKTPLSSRPKKKSLDCPLNQFSVPQRKAGGSFFGRNYFLVSTKGPRRWIRRRGLSQGKIWPICISVWREGTMFAESV